MCPNLLDSLDDRIMYIDEDHFGIPTRNLVLSLRWTEKKRRKHRIAIQVPTRKEVQRLPFAELRAILIGWMVHSPAELVPSRGQIAIVLDLLSRRADAHAMGDLGSLCRNYIEGA
jgi:hypothetical protein